MSWLDRHSRKTGAAENAPRHPPADVNPQTTSESQKQQSGGTVLRGVEVPAPLPAPARRLARSVSLDQRSPQFSSGSGISGVL
jgi:hypothetical protein